MASSKYEKKYTKPELRESLKAEIKQSDKGGKPGQWSARKSQFLVQEYERQGGGYRQDEKDDAAKSLEEWTEQNWQTADGDGQARENGITKRYLPEDVWDRLSEEEKRRAERTKESGSQSGQQYVDWTPAIKRAMAAEGHTPDGDDAAPTKQELYEQAQKLDIEGRSQMNKAELQIAVQEATAADTDELGETTKQELYEMAQDLDISGRSQMDKEELLEAVRQADT
ncbi:MAG: Rho termination factor N-terminal domain-containing protein [Cyanobacteria bacterium P01_C01_bin.120]